MMEREKTADVWSDFPLFYLLKEEKSSSGETQDETEEEDKQ